MKKKRPVKRLNPDTVTLMKQILLGVLVTALTALLIYGIWYGTRQPEVTIDTVTVSGGETIDHEIIKERVWEQLQGSYIKLVPYRFSYLYPRQKIIESIAGMPRIKTIVIDRIGRKELAVSVTEYTAAYLWCDESQESCYFTDGDTFAFAAAPNLKGGSFLRLSTPDREPEVGQTVLSKQEQTELSAFLHKMTEKGWLVTAVSIDRAADAYLTIASGGELKISLKESAEQSFANLETALSADGFASVVPGEFRYIDLRFGNKVFVNRTDEVAATTTEPVDVVLIADNASNTAADEIATTSAIATATETEEVITATEIAEESTVEPAATTTTEGVE